MSDTTLIDISILGFAVANRRYFYLIAFKTLFVFALYAHLLCMFPTDGNFLVYCICLSEKFLSF